jgi:hypothetical protein
MKLILLIVLVPVPLWAQTGSHNVILKTSPAHFLASNAKAGAEIKLNSGKHGLGLFGSQSFLKKTNEFGERRKLKGYGAELQYKLYLTGKKNDSAKQVGVTNYFMFFGSAGKLTETFTHPDGPFYSKAIYKSKDFGAAFGWQAIWKRVAADFYFGLGNRGTDATYEGSRVIDIMDTPPPKKDLRYPALDYSGFYPKLGIEIGITL